MRINRISAIGILATLLYLSSCTTVQSPAAPAPVEEIHPGLLAGYLPTNELPNSLDLLPPPPQPGSAAFARDEEIANATFVLRGTERWEHAAKDANLNFPAATDAFAEVIGFQPSETETPFLYQLLWRTLTDAGLSSYTAKDHYQRPRPFMINGQAIATPDDELELRSDGSYPSGHTAIGTAWSLILTELVPEKTDAILRRGYDFGQSRVICNVHWQSDVDAGRIMGAAAVARLHANLEFQNDLARAKEEVLRMQTEN